MNTPLDIQNAMSMAQNTPLKSPHAGATPNATKAAAKEFESVFISQFLGSMFEGVQTDGMFGGGEGEQMFRSMMLDQYGKSVADQGGLGLADSITRSLGDHQAAQMRAHAAAAQAKADGKPADAPMLATQNIQPVFAAHPAAAAAFALPAKTPTIFAAHPATLFAASAAASGSPARSAAR